METTTRKRHREISMMGSTSTSSSVNQTSEFAFTDFCFNDRVLHLHIIPHSSDDSESSDEVEVIKTLNLSSHILALKSPFFYKLFGNGMRESQPENDLSLTINADEEATFMDLINFMYEFPLKATSSADFLDVLIAADKFEVNSCITHCVGKLLEFPMSHKSALLYLDLPSCVLTSQEVRPLIHASKSFIAEHYKDITKYQQEVMELSLSKVKIVLGSKVLQIESEDDLYDFILKWARASYPVLEERQEINTKHLARFICFQNLSISKLKEGLVCPEFDHKQGSRLLVDALCYKAEHPSGLHIHTSKDLATTNRGFSGRGYLSSCGEVYFDITKDELKSLFPSKTLMSHPFCLGGKQLYLVAQCCPVGNHHHLALCVNKVRVTNTSLGPTALQQQQRHQRLILQQQMHQEPMLLLQQQMMLQQQQMMLQQQQMFQQAPHMRQAPNLRYAGVNTELKLGYEFAVRNKSSMDYQIKLSIKSATIPVHGLGPRNLLGIEWTELTSEDSEYFISYVLQIRAQITLL